MVNTDNISTKDYLDMDLLRFTTVGSVDDGKSTLIGRLLYDSKSTFEDQMVDIVRTSKKSGDENINLALLTDGLRAEREQGITIDVAYRYFATPKRKFIIADTPGHIEYTRNMVTGASTANLAIILIDARKGVIEQTKRHSYIASLLQIKHAIVCVNKMDLVDYDENIFESIKESFKELLKNVPIPDVSYIPISALYGDNVVTGSKKMPWFSGGNLLQNLESVVLDIEHDFENFRFPIQRVIRPQSNDYHDFRGYAGRISGGVISVGDTVKALPSGLGSKVKSIIGLDEEVNKAFPPMSVCITLEDNIDLSRGDMLVDTKKEPVMTQSIKMIVCWLNSAPLTVGKKYLVLHTTSTVSCIIKEIHFKMDINSITPIEEHEKLNLNDIAQVSIKTTKPIFIDSYKSNRKTGSLILIDPFTHETVGAGMII